MSNIILTLDDCEVIYPSDTKGLISKFFLGEGGDVSLIQDMNWRQREITHAIIFDDGEVFTDELAYVKSLGISCRYLKVQITRVINIKRETEYEKLRSTTDYEYIGRGSYWGNPYSMYDGSGDDRQDVIRKFKYDFDNDKFIKKKKSEVTKLLGKRLGCFCKPLDCHGDVLAEYLNGFDDGL